MIVNAGTEWERSIRSTDTRHKHSCALSEYLYDKLLGGIATPDDEWCDGEGNFIDRFGKRWLVGTDQGHVGIIPFEDEAHAKAQWDEVIEFG